ncbi:complement C1q-like protein 2 [Gambusia affinis]|uniref:complement C1q-like protein 2 n=1 Tax=Gambusia affinis TaxID=33528 RepID=UPI001CDD836C|nr:complement C1q-like protein 2 [Gambusia affinis]
MIFTLCLLVCFCGLTLGQEDLPETEVTSETGSCFPDMCKFLKEFEAMKAKLEAVETNLKETESQVLVLKSKEALKVVFSAGILGNSAIGPFDTPKTLVYTRVITNLGNAYNQHTGIFVAPVRGMYYFSFFYHAGGEHAAHLFLMKNNDRVLESYDQMTLNDGADNGGNAAFMELQQGDQVYIQLIANTHVWGNSYSTIFSGYLLYQI